MSIALPNAKPSQPYVHVSVLEAGKINCPELYVILGGSPTHFDMLPSMSFILRHSHNGQNIVFDLGLRKDWENYPPNVVNVIKTGCHVDIPVDAVDSLRRGGLEPHEVNTVILSHVHFDHVGDPALFPSAHFVIHEDGRALLAGGYDPEDDKSSVSADFAKHLLPESRTSYLCSDSWEPIGPFPRAHDFYGDGSVYIVDAPGHLPGHINLLVRTSTDGSWVLLAGDSAHDVRILTGEKDIGVLPTPNGPTSLHRDLPAAKENIERIKRLMTLEKVLVLLAHDLRWLSENWNKGVIFPGVIPPL